MRFLTIGLCIACIPVFSQVRDAQAQEVGLRSISKDEILGRFARSVRIQQHIAMHQPIQLPSLGSKASIVATGFKSYDGHVLRLVGIEVTTDNVILQSDELTYDWDSGDLELTGNVRLKAVPQQ